MIFLKILPKFVSKSARNYFRIQIILIVNGNEGRCYKIYFCLKSIAIYSSISRRRISDLVVTVERKENLEYLCTAVEDQCRVFVSFIDTSAVYILV